MTVNRVFGPSAVTSTAAAIAGAAASADPDARDGADPAPAPPIMAARRTADPARRIRRVIGMEGGSSLRASKGYRRQG
jgi:hypothetical protein